MIKVGIIGATGYAGNELVRLLLGHKDAEIVWLGSRSYIDQNYSDVYRNMFKLVDAKCMDDNMEQLANEVDVIFTATPQQGSRRRTCGWITSFLRSQADGRTSKMIDIWNR